MDKRKKATTKCSLFLAEKKGEKNEKHSCQFMSKFEQPQQQNKIKAI